MSNGFFAGSLIKLCARIRLKRRSRIYPCRMYGRSFNHACKHDTRRLCRDPQSRHTPFKFLACTTAAVLRICTTDNWRLEFLLAILLSCHESDQRRSMLKPLQVISRLLGAISARRVEILLILNLRSAWHVSFSGCLRRLSRHCCHRINPTQPADREIEWSVINQVSGPDMHL
jgi:hypothetical protein